MAKLTDKERAKLPAAEFALPRRRYPMEDEAHARNALARVSQFGSPTMQREVRDAVNHKFPNIGARKK